MLNKDVLGQDLYNARNAFNNLTATELITAYGSLANARLAACKADAEAIINHFKSSSLLTIPGTGLAAGPTAVTGNSITGTIQ